MAMASGIYDLERIVRQLEADATRFRVDLPAHLVEVVEHIEVGLMSHRTVVEAATPTLPQPEPEPVADPCWPYAPFKLATLVQLLRAPGVARLSRPQQLVEAQMYFGREIPERQFRRACRVAGPRPRIGRSPE